MVTDTHCHLEIITADPSQQRTILEQCKKEQIRALINVSVDTDSNFNSEKLSQNHEEVFFSAGIHPHEALHYAPEDIQKIEPLLLSNKCVAVGEVGLDLYYGRESVKEQFELLDRFLYLAKRHDKPVIIHSRRSFQEVLSLLKKPEYQGVRGVFHCFSYSYEEAKQCLNLGYKISFAGNVTFKKASDIQEAARRIPLRELLLETDAPFLAPAPVRGKRNFPYYILHTARFLSVLRNEPYEEMLKKIEENVRAFFPAIKNYVEGH